MPDLEALEKRIQILEDIEAIKQLKNEYMLACDDSYNPERIAALFVEDGVWDGGELDGVHHGREEIKEWFRHCSKENLFAVHMAMAPIVEVDGDTARGRWYMNMYMTHVKHGATLYADKYDDQFVKIDGKWYFKYLNVREQIACVFTEGWAEDRFSAYK